jgi:tetratricopeptide (TPR) repeat protein
MLKAFAILLISVVCYFLFSPYFIANMKSRPLFDKLGYTPQGKFYKAALGEFRWFTGDLLSFKSIIYYGGKMDKILRSDYKDVELYNLYRTVETSVLLNPYNEDAYYFAQGAFNWEVGQTKAVNSILKYVMKYRTWDFKLPFFLGFNYAYFLKDYKEAAKYYKKAGEMTGSPLFNKLAARYLYEGGDTALGISYLKFLIKSERDEKRRKVYLIRLKALEGINQIEIALKKYKEKYKTLPKNIDELVAKGFLKSIPKDPYGGEYYLDKNGKVRTTSKMAFAKKTGQKNESNSNK